MKFDIVRAWKDEAYRQSLSDEQRILLPANPAGELSEAEMAMVCGGGGGFGAGGGGGGAPVVTPAAPVASHRHAFHGHAGGGAVATTSSAASASSGTHLHSWGLLCDVSLFSVNLIQVPIIPIASPFTQTCVECD